MNTYYDLVVNPDWGKRSADVRGKTEDQLRDWMQIQSPNVIISKSMWVGDWYTQILRCKSEYQAFEARLIFGEIFSYVRVTEQLHGPYTFL